MEIIKNVKLKADRNNISTVVITFDPHPKSILQSNVQQSLNILTNTDKKLEFSCERSRLADNVMV